ncbi:hypothetical protein JCM10213_001777 [Rhodosporidiobolus nylandii]
MYYDEKDVELASQTSRAYTETSGLARSPAREPNPALALPPRLSTLRERVPARARIAGDFRTLSLEVTDTRRAAARVEKGKADKNIADLAQLDWHLVTPDEACQRLGVSPVIGLDAQIVARRLAADGKNALNPPKTNWPKKIFFYFFGGFGSLLFVASVLCFVAWRPLGDPKPAAANLALAIVLLLVVLLQAVFNAIQDWTTSRTMSSIANVLPTTVLVRRDGQVTEVSAVDLVKGDIVLLKGGVKVPADLRIIEASPDLKLDRSILTGESIPVSGTIEKTDDNFLESKNVALGGTLVVEGSAVGVCVGTGDLTVFGRIAKAASGERKVKTTLEVEISRFVLIIASLAAAVVALIVILWAAWLRRDHPGFINVPTLIIDCVSVAVAFIPEGLPFCVTSSLTIIARSMKKRGVLVKKLSIVEALGAVDVLCSDKTGTLTQNLMTAVNLTLGTQSSTVTDARRIASNPSDPAYFALSQLVSIAGICNDATFASTDSNLPLEARKINGDATDTGLLRFAESVASVEAARKSVVQVERLAFNSRNKYALKLVKPARSSGAAVPQLFDTKDGEAEQVLLVKGAPDVLLRRCTSLLQADGSTVPLTPDLIDQLTSAQSSFASQGQRVLMFAKRAVSSATDNTIGTPEERMVSLVEDLTVVGLVALVDPPKHDTKETVERCRTAGIRFFMVTGDYAATAHAIGRQVGIVTVPHGDVKNLDDLSSKAAAGSGEKEVEVDVEPAFRRKTALVLSGPEIIRLSEEMWSRVLKFDEIVFARTTPQQKLQIVKRFQAAGCTVAVTGDGVNDSPALKQADVGVAVAGGSEVAMEAADLVLLRDFSSIIDGIEAGRLCFDNLQKTVLYLLPAGSFSELMPVLLNVLFGLPQALSSIQMILICAVTDVLPALSLCFEKPEADLLTRPPRNRKTDRLANWRLLLQAYAFLGLIESLTSMVGAFYFGFHRAGIPFSALWLKYGGYDVDPAFFAERLNVSQSIYLWNLVIIQFFNLLSTRTRRLSLFQQDPLLNPRTRNLRLFPAMLFALCLGIFFSYLPFFQRVFLTRGKGLKVEHFFLPMAYGVGLLFLDEARKWRVRSDPKGWVAWLAW